MTLRLVLVSLVAALGLTIPGAPMIESWVASTQNWMNARFADWDTRNPQTADYVIVSEFYDVERLAPRPAISSAPVATPTLSNAPPERSTLETAAAAKALPNKAPLVLAAPVTHDRPASFVRTVVVFEPIEPSETLCLGVAEELNRRSDGIVPARITHIRAPLLRVDLNKTLSSIYRGITTSLAQWSKIAASLPPRAASPLRPQRRIEPMMVFDNLYGGVSPRTTIKLPVAQAKPVIPSSPVAQAKPVTLKPEVALAKPVPATVTVPAKVQTQAPRPAAILDTRFVAMEGSPSLYFFGNLTVPAYNVVSARLAPPVSLTPGPEPKPAPKASTAASPKATAVAVSPKPATPAGMPQEVMDDLDVEFAEALLPQDDGFGADAPSAVKRVPALVPRLRFEPLEVGPELSVGIAHELNRRSEGLKQAIPGIPTAPRVATSTPRPTRELNRAVKLTRDAVYAWVNVFTGPALVTVSQSNDPSFGR